MREFDDDITSNLETQAQVLIKATSLLNPKHLIDIYDEEPDFVADHNWVIDVASIHNVDTITPDSYYAYLEMGISLPRGTDLSLLSAWVKSHTLDQNNETIGKAHNNPLFDSKRYEVEYIGENTETLSANIVA